MRIVFVTTEYITNKDQFNGGLGNYLYRVAKALVSLGHDVNIIVLAENKNKFNHDGIQVYNLLTSDLTRLLLNRLTRYRIVQTLNCLDFSFQAYRKLMQLHKQKPFDIVQFPDWDACGLISSFLLPIPQVVRISGCRAFWKEKEYVNLDERIMEWFELLQLRQNKHIYSPSYLLKQLLENETKITNVDVIRTPFYIENTNWDLSIYNDHLKDKKYLLFFVRLNQRIKGFHILAKALPSVLEKHSDCHVVLVGKDASSSIASSIKEYLRSLCYQYSDRLVFIEKELSHAELYPIIEGARLVVLPSLIDNLPNACLESMALGTPVIGTYGASFDEIISEGETGFLVPSGDVDALTAKIHEVWIHPNLDEIGRAAKYKMQDFLPQTLLKQLLIYYDSVHKKYGDQSKTIGLTHCQKT